MLLESRPPTAPLAPFIKEFWSVNAAPAETDLRPNYVLPDGTSSLMFNLSGYEHRDIDPANLRRFSRLKQAWISGLRGGRICIAPTVCTRVVGVRFKPGGLAPFFDRPVSEISAATVDLDLLWRRETDRVGEQLFAAESTRQRFDALERWMIARARVGASPDRRVLHCVELLRQTHGVITVKSLAESVGLTQRHLSRLFAAQVGLRPKALARVLRFQSLVASLESIPTADIDWAGVALRFGYYDQSHLVDEMKELCGLTPGEYLRRRGPMLNFLAVADEEMAGNEIGDSAMSVFSKTA